MENSYDRFKDPRHIYWAKKVKERDNFTCQICGVTNVYLNSHHCNSWDHFVDERFDVDNGITLCSTCHQAFHNIYSFTKNTKYQFEEFQKFCVLISKIAIKNIKNNK